MSAIYEEIVLGWEGKEYTVRPDYRMVQRIESRGISIFGVIESLRSGQPLYGRVAEIIACLLESGGAKHATPARVYEHLIDLIRNHDEKEMLRITAAVALGFIPQQRPAGNSGAPAEGAGTDA